MKTVIKFRIISVLQTVLLCNYPAGVQADELYFIDAHSQVDHKVVPLDSVISVIEKGEVRHTMLSARGKLQGKGRSLNSAETAHLIARGNAERLWRILQ